MFKLVVNPGTEQAWEIELGEGATALGRGPESAVVLDHASVSSRHAEIIIAGNTATLRDLGSTAGSYVDGQLVEEARIAPGQRFKLGEVELELGTVGPPLPSNVQPTVAAGRPAGSPPAARHCKHHPRVLAQWRCPRCGHFYCPMCVSIHAGGRSSNHFCRMCGTECEPVAVEVKPPERRSFYEQWPGAFSYPLKGNGVALLVAGTVFFVILDGAMSVAGCAPLIGLPAVVLLTMFSTGYLFNYAKTIITTSAAKAEGPPDWPDFGDWWEDVVVPFGQCVTLCLLCYGPAMLLDSLQPFGPKLSPMAALAALVVGALVFPMGTLAVAIFDRVLALNPVLLVGVILRIPRQYSVAALLFEVIAAIYWFGGGLLERLLPVPMLPALLSSFVSLYLTVVGMRMLGLLYDAHKAELGWIEGRKLRD